MDRRSGSLIGVGRTGWLVATVSYALSAGLALGQTHAAATAAPRAATVEADTARPKALGIATAEVAQPRPVAAAPAIPVEQKSAFISAVKAAGVTFAARDVYALADNKVVRVTDENAAQLLSKPTVTAERVAAAAVKTAVPKTFGAQPGEGSEAFTLPTRYTTLPLGSAQPVHFNIVLAVLDALHYDVAVRKFVGRIAMALINPENRDDTSALSHEVPVMVAADGAEFVPTQVKFSALNAPLELHLTVLAPADPYSIGAMTALNTSPDSIVVPVRRPDIEVRPVSDHIRGLGLEETRVIIRVAEARGRQGEAVALQAVPGSISPSPVVLDDTGTGVAMLRSTGIGSAVVTATDPPFHEGVGSVRFGWPVAFVLATLAGGVIGALLRKDARQQLGRSLFIGVLAALVVGVAHTVGINFEAWGTPAGGAGEGLFFVIAAIAGFLGREAMERLASGGK